MVSIETGRVKDHCIVDKRYTRVGRDMIRIDKILAYTSLHAEYCGTCVMTIYILSKHVT